MSLTIICEGPACGVMFESHTGGWITVEDLRAPDAQGGSTINPTVVAGRIFHFCSWECVARFADTADDTVGPDTRTARARRSPR